MTKGENNKMKPEHRKFYFAFDADLDSSYELPYGMSYARALKEQRPEIYQSFLSGWIDKILETQEFPQRLIDEALKEEGLL